MGRIFNFSAGPAVLPLEVLETIRDELVDYQGSGMSIMEMSHRGKIFEGVLHESMDKLRKVTGLPDRMDILYMTGGASTQFALIPMNLSAPGRTVGYVNSGYWAKKAIEQAKLLGVDAYIAASSESTNHDHIPSPIQEKDGLDYLHITTNNTIFGTQFPELPRITKTKLAVDMSSDFLSKPVDWSCTGIVYAGMQKNAGPSGLTIVGIDKEYYARESEKTPTMFRYSTYAQNESMFNTPPTFQIYVFGLVLKWIEKMGGLAGMARHNEKKASHIYKVIDEFPDFYLGHAKRGSRSLMNITWNLADKTKEEAFLKGTVERRMSGLKGHRAVGGLRASIYNAMPEEGCIALAEYMREFVKK